MRIIDADALKRELDAWAILINKPRFYSREDALHIIDCAPTVEPPVVQGRWVNKALINKIWSACSVCDTLFNTDLSNAKYCPECGAKMEATE